MKFKGILKAGQRLKAAIMVILAVSSTLSVLIVAQPAIQLGEVSFRIHTDKTTYQYGDIVKIDVVLSNDGRLPATLHFVGYGSNLFELEVQRLTTETNTFVAPNTTSQSRDLTGNSTAAPIDFNTDEYVFNPTDHPLARYFSYSVTLAPGEKRTSHFEWGLNLYSSGGCTGPRYGNLVAPGSFAIKASLNLDPQFAGIEKRATRTIEVAPMSYTQIDTSSDLVNSSAVYKSAPDLSIVNGELRIQFKPRFSSYEKDPVDVQNLTHPRAYRFENDLYFVEVRTNTRSYAMQRPAGWDDTTAIRVSIPLKDQTSQVKVGFFDLSEPRGWGSSGPVITEVQA